LAKRTAQTDGSVYQKTTLKNGLRVVTERTGSVRSISLGVWVDVGARNESPQLNGVTHLIEHMLFKGTKNRNARQIASEIENIGGSLNAFTSKESTCYLARVMYEHLETALDVLADLAQNATITPNNLDKEKKVVCEEIKESLETPSDHVHDLFAEAYWGKHPLGQPILGSLKTVSKIPRKSIVNYMKSNYKAESVVLAASGAISHSKLVKLAKEKFKFAEGKAEVPAVARRSQDKCLTLSSNSLSQSHLCIGFPGVDYKNPLRTAVVGISTYLGGGMSSVLFQKIREQKGLAYTVYTYHETFRDAGVFGAYVATEPGSLTSALSLIIKECNRLKKKKLSTVTLDQIKAQLKGNITLAMESTSARMNRLARQELVLEKYYSLDQMLKEIGKLKPSDILKAANLMFNNDSLAIAVKGPADKKALENVI
jgi:predicted Zn-dependent peptidase